MINHINNFNSTYIWGILISVIIIIMGIIWLVWLYIDSIKESEYYSSFKSEHIVIGGAVYNCEQYIDAVFKNIEKIGKLFKKYSVVIAIDKGTDGSLEKLKSWESKCSGKLYILEGVQTGDYRTERISNARNRILEKMREIYSKNPFDHFIMMDCDNVCSKPINLNVFKGVFGQKDRWDAVSFIGSEVGEYSWLYYDFWALSIPPFMLSCWHYDKPDVMIHQMNTYITQEINKKEWIPCYSAFNGFAIYKSTVFLKYKYHWKVEDIVDLIPKDTYKESIKKASTYDCYFDIKKQVFDCEHRYFHLSAKRDGAKLFIVPEKICFI